MVKTLRYLFQREKKPLKGLLAAEWAMLAYLLLTLLLMLFTYTKVVNPEAMLWGRFRIAMTTLALWAVYRMLPCRLTRLCRIAVQMAMLSWWYPDTYEFNRMFPNLDHVFAGFDQQLFGCQPALLFSQVATHPVFSELMHLGYTSYYPLIVLVTLYYFFRRYEALDRTAFVIMAGFFVYYVVFIFLPVTGPQYYYPAVGADTVAGGVFPDVGSYFATHQERVALPGWSDGFFFQMVESAHAAGERPTAAFPSSHVGITLILMILAWKSRSRWLFWGMMPMFVLMCLATVYIQAHYAVDVIGGWLSGVAIYLILNFFYGKICPCRK